MECAEGFEERSERERGENKREVKKDREKEKSWGCR